MKNLVFHGRSKHIGTPYHFICDCVEKRADWWAAANILMKFLANIKSADTRHLLGTKDLRGENFSINLRIVSWLNACQSESKCMWAWYFMRPKVGSINCISSTRSPYELIEFCWLCEYEPKGSRLITHIYTTLVSCYWIEKKEYSVYSSPACCAGM